MMIAQLVLVCRRFVGLNARLRADAGSREGRPVSHVTRNTGLVVLAACLAALLATSAGSVSAADETSLSGVKLMPSSGDTNALFTFMIVYRGTAAPTARDLYLDSKCYAMKSAGAAPGGGIMYTYQTKLAAGTHKYRFRFLVGTVNLFMPGPAATDWYTSPNIVQAKSFTISGIVRCDGAGLPGVGIRLTKQGTTAVTTRTDSQGRYTVKGLAPGTWRVTPSLSGYTMAPDYITRSLPPDTTTCDFAATRVPRQGRAG
jgi:hypothetical protein